MNLDTLDLRLVGLMLVCGGQGVVVPVEVTSWAVDVLAEQNQSTSFIHTLYLV